MSTYAEGMGVATGIAFDRIENLYVGDRNGTIFKVAPDRQIFVFGHVGAERFRLPYGLWAEWGSLCDWADHIQFRRGFQN